MAHYAELDASDIVVRVLVVPDAETRDETGIEHDHLGHAYLRTLLPDSGNWVRTSYNNNIRKRYAGIGYKYDRERDEFVPPNYVLVNNEWTAPDE